MLEGEGLTMLYVIQLAMQHSDILWFLKVILKLGKFNSYLVQEFQSLVVLY
jgi:hypothetical protein